MVKVRADMYRRLGKISRSVLPIRGSVLFTCEYYRKRIHKPSNQNARNI
jgi:hypothetical protein